MRPHSTSNAAAPAPDQADAGPSETLPLIMPESDEETAARDIAAVSVEGRPGNASAGPGLLLIEMGMLVVVVLTVAVALGWGLGWVYGGAALVLGGLAILFNPVMGAAALRVRDRQIAARNERRAMAQLDRGSPAR